MNPEEIKVGETYNVRVRVALIEPNRFVCRPLNQDGTPSDFCPNYFNFAEAEAFYPADGIKSAKNAQKYDPCRPFRAGDIVEPCQVKGRWLSEAWKGRAGIHFTVVTDENETGTMSVKDPDSVIDIYVDAVYFQLVAPVEELERYVVIHNGYEKYYEVCWKDDDEPDGRTGRTRCLTTFWYHNPPKTHTQEHAKAAAEAECDRLNAEYRKEVEK